MWGTAAGSLWCKTSTMGNGANLQSNDDSKTEVSWRYLTKTAGWCLLFSGHHSLQEPQKNMGFNFCSAGRMIVTTKMTGSKDGPSTTDRFSTRVPRRSWEVLVGFLMLGLVDYVYQICKTSHGFLSHVEMCKVNSMNSYCILLYIGYVGLWFT